VDVVLVYIHQAKQYRHFSRNGEVSWVAYVGTAGEMFDFSPAAGLEPMLSSFSRIVFSWEMILRVAMFAASFDMKSSV